MSTIPLVDLVAAHREVGAEVDAELADVFATAGFIGGSRVAAFEDAYASFLGVAHCVGVANGTDALELALRAVRVGPGDEVVLPAHTFIATAEAVVRCGADVVLCDVDDDEMLMDPQSVERVMTSATKVVIPVHLYGQSAPVEAIAKIAEQFGAVMVEDAAQSQGATRLGRHTGSFGTVSATSFYPGKNLGAAGDAGAVLTDDPELAARVRLLANHGSSQKYVHVESGLNSRLDAVQAVVLSAKLRRLEEWNSRRRELADRYAAGLSGLSGVRLPTVADDNEHVWHLYVIRVAERDRVVARLNERGIGAGIHYPQPIHGHEAFAHLGYARGAFPVAERIADDIVSLPIYPHLSDADQDRVIDELSTLLA